MGGKGEGRKVRKVGPQGASVALGLPCREGLCRTWALEGGAWKQQGQEVDACLGQEKSSSLPGGNGAQGSTPHLRQESRLTVIFEA